VIGPRKLPTFAAPLAPAPMRADGHEVLWLILTWLMLIALWGTSERWDLASVRRRVLGAVQQRARSARTHPHD
jgi:hypothetical protein